MACDEKKIFKLLVKKGLLDMNESKICADMTSFPAIKLNLKEANYDLNGMPVAGGNEKQEKIVADLHKFFNGVLSDGEKLGISTRGYADGTYRKSENDDERIKTELFDNDKLSWTKLEKQIKGMDPVGYNSILAELKKMTTQPPTFDQIKANRHIMSMVRNSYLAKNRGENICNILFQDPSKCDNQGEISASLDQGKSCYDGCCDGRRGAQVQFTLPSQIIKTEESKATWQPGFELAKGDFARKLQFGSTFSVLDLKVPADDKDYLKMEEAVLTKGEITDNMIEKDRERFKKILEGSGCAANDMIVDSVRKIWWKLKKIRPYLRDDIGEAFDKKDFDKAYSLMLAANVSKKEDFEVSAFKMMISGGLKDVSATADSQCAHLTLVNTAYTSMEDKAYKDCKLDTNSDPDLLKYDNVQDLAKSSAKNGESIIASTDEESPGVFWVFNPITGKKKIFTYGKECGSAPGYVNTQMRTKKLDSKWGDLNAAPKKHYNTNCFQIKAQNTYNELDDNRLFTKAVNSNGGGLPTDHMACLSVAKVYDSELKSNPDSVKTLGKPYCDVAKNNTLTLEFDYRKVTPIQGQHGFICQRCTSGVKYNSKQKKFIYAPRIDKTTGSDNATLLAYDQTLNNKTNQLTYGSTKHIRTFLIPNCGSSCADACACLKGGNIQQLTKDAEIVDFTDLSKTTEFPLKKYKGDGSGSFACFFTPQVPNTCGVDPAGHSHTEDTDAVASTVSCKLELELNKLADKVSEPTSDEIDIYNKKCQSDPFPMPESQCAYADNNICAGIQKANNCPVPATKSSSGGKGNATHQ